MSAEPPATTARKRKAPLRDSTVDSGLIGNNGRIRTTVINKDKSKNNSKRYREEVLDPDAIRTHTPKTPSPDIIDKYWSKYTIKEIDNLITALGRSPPSGDKMSKISHLYHLETEARKLSIDNSREDEDTSEEGQHLTDEEVLSRAPPPAASILNAFTSKLAHTTPSSTSTASSPIVIPGDVEGEGAQKDAVDDSNANKGLPSRGAHTTPSTSTASSPIVIPGDDEGMGAHKDADANEDLPSSHGSITSLESTLKLVLEHIGDLKSSHHEDMRRINEQFTSLEEKMQGKGKEQEQEGAPKTRVTHYIPDSYVYPTAGRLLREPVRKLLRDDARIQVNLHGFQTTAEATKDRQIRDRVDALLGELGNSNVGAACLFYYTKQVNDFSYEFRKNVHNAVATRLLEGDSDQLYAFCQIWDKSEDDRCVAFMNETKLPKPFQPGQFYLLKTGALKKTSVLVSLSKMVADKYAALDDARQKARRAALRQVQQIDESEE